MLAVASSDAASDTDVTLLRAETVLIEGDQVTIVAEAITSIILISGDHDPGYEGFQRWGRPAERVKIKSDKATFVIRRAQPTFHDPDGTHAEERERGLKTLKEAWEMTLDAARALQEGKEVGRIGYHRPVVTIKGNLITLIDGFGYLYPKGK